MIDAGNAVSREAAIDIDVFRSLHGHANDFFTELQIGQDCQFARFASTRWVKTVHCMFTCNRYRTPFDKNTKPLATESLARVSVDPDLSP